MPDLLRSRRDVLRRMAAAAVAGSAGAGLVVGGCTPDRGRMLVTSFPTRSHLLTHVIQPLFGAGEPPGRFAPGSSSGRFRPLAPKAVVDDVVTRMGDAAVAVLAGQGFVDDGGGLRLALPVKRGGQLLSGGSGAPASAAGLMALAWNGPSMALSPYDPASGEPLAGPQWPDGLVAPVVDPVVDPGETSDAAARVGDSWQLAGLSDGDGGSFHVVTGQGAPRAEGIAQLRQLGVAGPLISLGNPGAALLWQPGPGFQVLPGGSPDPAQAAPLPHYLAILSLA